jgi:signal transduction histidine kinase
VTQALFSMTLTTRSIEMLIERDPPAAVERLAELRQLERDALAEMRALIFELRPGNLENDGLVQAVRTLAAGIESRTALPITVEAEAVERYAPSHEDALYRLAQEAIHNVIKHASASRVRVALAERDGELRLAVEDDGAGFDPTRVPAGHLGLAGMRTRAERLGGWMHVASSPGTGTRVEVALPIVRRQDVASDAVAGSAPPPSVAGSAPPRSGRQDAAEPVEREVPASAG